MRSKLIPVMLLIAAQASELSPTLPTVNLPDSVQDGGALTPDRPGFTEPTTVVGLGFMQAESGVTLERFARERATVFTFPSTTLRYGVTPNIELRLSTDSLVARTGDEASQGFADVQIGAKVKIFDERKWLPSFAILPILSAPSGAAASSSGTFDPMAKFAFGKSLPWGIGVGGNMNHSVLKDTIGRWNQRTVSLSVDRTLWRGFSGYWEVYRHSALERHDKSSSIFNTGIMRGIGRNIQVDLEWGRSLRNPKPGWFVAGGLTVRKRR